MIIISGGKKTKQKKKNKGLKATQVLNYPLLKRNFNCCFAFRFIVGLYQIYNKHICLPKHPNISSSVSLKCTPVLSPFPSVYGSWISLACSMLSFSCFPIPKPAKTRKVSCKFDVHGAKSGHVICICHVNKVCASILRKPIHQLCSNHNRCFDDLQQALNHTPIHSCCSLCSFICNFDE